ASDGALEVILRSSFAQSVNFVTDSNGQAQIQVQTGDDPGELRLSVTVGDMQSTSVVQVVSGGGPGTATPPPGGGDDDDRTPGPGAPRPPDTGSAPAGGTESGSTAWMWLMGIAGTLIVVGGGTAFVARRNR